VEQVAERVVTLLLERVERGEQGEGRSVKVVPELIVRGSCAAPSAALRGARKPARRG
jgi:DNA-binding LacI/PurR family transcriptional regulator